MDNQPSFPDPEYSNTLLWVMGGVALVGVLLLVIAAALPTPTGPRMVGNTDWQLLLFIAGLLLIFLGGGAVAGILRLRMWG